MTASFAVRSCPSYVCVALGRNGLVNPLKVLVSAATEGAARKGSNPAGGANIWPSQRRFLKGPLDHRAIAATSLTPKRPWFA